MDKTLDLITIGRSSVDLYGEQIGGRLEDMGSFKKYIGGSPTNIAAGGARLGLQTALITKVGDEHMGRFIREELIREGVDVTAVKTDPERLTALVLLGIKDENSFPLIFYRENCADMGLTEEDIDPEFIAQAKCLCATGTHLSNPKTAAAVKKALRLAKETGSKTVLDIDYRPNLWGLGGHDEGENRFVASNDVTEIIQSTVGIFDLIVGTEEEFHIAGGSGDTITALRNVRKHTKAILVCKMGPMGAVAFEEEIPDHIQEGITGPGFNVEVFNVLGAGDGFMAGFLKGWLSDEDLPTSLQFANACGALAVSRHGCTPSYPSMLELHYFLRYGSHTKSLRKNFELEQIHWSTNRRSNWMYLTIVSLEDLQINSQLASGYDSLQEKEEQFKRIIVKSIIAAKDLYPPCGVILPASQKRSLIDEITGKRLFLAKSIGILGSGPLLEVEDNFVDLSEWPLEITVKVKVSIEPGSKAEFETSLHYLNRLLRHTRKNRQSLALELGFGTKTEGNTKRCVEIINCIYEYGIFPDYWILNCHQNLDLYGIDRFIHGKDLFTQGILAITDDPDKLVYHDPNAPIDPAGHATGRIITGADLGEIWVNWLTGKITNSEAEIQITDWIEINTYY